jgi:(p)ppGpp synthase/HD superfamily hydrolase
MDIARAKSIAKKAHKGQVDKNGMDYMRHPIAVASLVSGTDATIVAYLHDVIEDTDVTLDDLRQEGFSIDIITAIDAISKRKGETNVDYIARVKENPLATRVKLADLKDNMSPAREIKHDKAMQERLMKKYLYAFEFLGGS